MKYPALFKCLPSLLLISLSIFPFSAVATETSAQDLIPRQNLIIEDQGRNGEEQQPEWQALWIKARNQVKRGNLLAAKATYTSLLQVRPNIEEAGWELCKLLCLLDDTDGASALLNKLLETAPADRRYLLAASELAFKEKKYRQAAVFLGQLYEKNPASEQAPKILNLLAQSYEAMGKRKTAILLYEQLRARDPGNNDILKKLATLSRKAGLTSSAKRYYSELLDRTPQDKEALFQAALLYPHGSSDPLAAKYWGQYLQLDSGYIPFRKNLADYYFRKHNYADAVSEYLVLYNSIGAPDSLGLKIADMYAIYLHRPDKALLYYERAFTHQAESEQVLLSRKIEKAREYLAEQYLPLVENGGENNLWEDLDQITVEKGDIFRRMLKKLHKSGNPDAEKRLLEFLYARKAATEEECYTLARILARENSSAAAYQLLQELQKKGFTDKSFLLLKADVEMKLGREQQALATSRIYLGYAKQDWKAWGQTLDLAGRLGCTDELRTIWSSLQQCRIPAGERRRLTLIYIGALRENALFDSTDPLYADLLEDITPGSEDWAGILFHKAETLYARHAVFEAEQLLRQVVAADVCVEDALERLVRLALREEHLPEAEIWFTLLKDYTPAPSGEKQIRLDFLRTEILSAMGKYEKAQDIIEKNILTAHPYLAQHPDLQKEAELYDIRADYYQHQNKRLLSKLTRMGADATVEYDVIRELLPPDPPQSAVPPPPSEYKDSFLRLLTRATLFRQYRVYSEALREINAALQIIPESRNAAILKLHILIDTSRYDEASQLIGLLNDTSADDGYLRRLTLELEYKRGHFGDVIDAIQSAEQTVQQENTARQILPESMGRRYWEKVLLARSLWAENRREEALAIYKDALQSSSAEEYLLQNLGEARAVVLAAVPKSSFLSYIPFASDDRESIAEKLMTPETVVQNRGADFNSTAASLYAEYRWEKQIAQELKAKKAIVKKDYYTAEKNYLTLFQQEKPEDSLVDLANIYNKLGLYGKEAELYELIKKKSPLYPGIDEYMNANILKRQPRVTTELLTERKRGRDNYINLKKDAFGIKAWFMPTYDQEVSVSAYHNIYDSYYDQGSANSNRIMGAYSTYYNDSLDINLSLGSEKPSDNAPDEFLYKVEVIGRATSSMDLYGRLEQDIVDDTIKSLTDSILRRDFEAGFKYDMFPRLFFGLDYRYRIYSDDNHQNRYKAWTSYHLFGEQNQIKLKYSYENIQNSDANLIEDGKYQYASSFIDRTYWSPANYWEHLFTVHFTHYFDGYSRPEAPLSYLSIDYSLGYEQDLGVNHQFDVNIFLEIDRHLLVKGNVGNFNGDTYKETDASLSFIYRW